MIGSLRGKVIFRAAKFAIIETNKVGYKVHTSASTLAEIRNEEEVLLWTHTHVREDALELYGFAERKELEFFEMLLNVPGIGPKGALSVLGVAPMETLKKAVAGGDAIYLTKISGIGKKTAHKIIVELREKINSQGQEGVNGKMLRGELDALEALKSLGYSSNEAREALQKTAETSNTNQKIKEALKILSGK